VCKNWLKIPNRLEKIVRKPQGGIFFDSHCMSYPLQERNRITKVLCRP